MDETVRNALLQFEDACTASGHALCGEGRTCEAGLVAVSQWQSERERALQFDVGRWAITKRMEFPEHDWSTPTLLVVARDALESQPNLDSLRRATVITTALARLGERGFPADCVARTCMGPKLLRRIILAAANVWCDIRTGSIDREDVPELEGWLQAIDADEQQEESRPDDRARVVLRSLRGLPRELGEQWLRSAALVHIIGWRLDDYITTEVHPEDLALPGGEQATRWVYERSTETYPEDWSPASLNWEATYRTHPREIAEHVGLALSVLQSRTVTEEQLGRARLEHILKADDAPEIDDMTLAEISDLALAQLEKGYSDGALQLAERAVRTTPRNVTVRALHAFCLLPSSPTTSRYIWSEMLDEANQDDWTGIAPDILLADIATSHLMCGDIASAQRTVQRLRDLEDQHEISAWLWDPGSLPQEPAVIHCTLDDWLDRFTVATSLSTPSPP